VTARAPGKTVTQAKTGKQASNIVLRLFFIFLVRFLAFRELSLKEQLWFCSHDLCRWLVHFESGIHFVDLLDLLFNLGGEMSHLVLLLRDGCLQVLVRD